MIELGAEFLNHWSTQHYSINENLQEIIVGEKSFPDSEDWKYWRKTREEPIASIIFDKGQLEKYKPDKRYDEIFWNNNIRVSLNDYLIKLYLINYNLFISRLLILMLALLGPTAFLVFRTNNKKTKKIFLFLLIIFLPLNLLCGRYVYSLYFSPNILPNYGLWDLLFSNNTSAVLWEGENLDILIEYLKNTQEAGSYPAPEYLREAGIKEVFIGKPPYFKTPFLRARINKFNYVYVMEDFTLDDLKIQCSRNIAFGKISSGNVWHGDYFNYNSAAKTLSWIVFINVLSICFFIGAAVFNLREEKWYAWLESNQRPPA